MLERGHETLKRNVELKRYINDDYDKMFLDYLKHTQTTNSTLVRTFDKPFDIFVFYQEKNVLFHCTFVH